MGRLGAYVQAETTNPLGHRPYSFALKSPMSANPTLTGYFPANYFVPTAGNVSDTGQANVLGDFSDFISDNSTLLMGLAVVGVLWYIMREPRRGKRRS